MLKKMIYNKHFISRLLLIGTLIFLFLHVLVALSILPYDKIWGTAVTGQAALVRAEQFTIVFLIIFIAGIVMGYKRQPLPVFARLGQGIRWTQAIYMALSVLGYLRSDSLPLKLGMGLFCLLLALLSAWLNILLRIDFQRNRLQKDRKRQSKFD